MFLFECVGTSRRIRSLHDMGQWMSENMLSKLDIANSFILVKTPVKPIA